MLIGLTTVLAVMVGSCFGLTRTVSHPQHKVVHFHGRNSMKLRSHGLDTQQLLDMLTASIQAVPVDISAFDKVATLGPGTPELVPDTTIKTLDGGDNLGALVWAVVLYNGIFLSGKPADWVLPPLAAALSSSEESWFKDYRAGYSFRTPPVVDFMRFALFLVAGYYFNVLIVTSLGGDTFWGWSIATCLAIPSGLLNASRPRRLSREEVELEKSIEEEFQSFVLKRMKPVAGSVTPEARIILAFRRACRLCRDEEEIPDKYLKKRIRRVLGAKPVEGSYLNIELSNLKRESEAALAKNLEAAEKLRSKAQQQREEMAAAQQEEIGEPVSENDFVGLFGGNTPTASDVKR